MDLYHYQNRAPDSSVDEFDQSERINEMEMLRSIIPSWEKAELEPFLTSAQQDVTPPTWNKLRMPDNDSGSSGPPLSFVTVTVTGCLNGSPAVGTAMYVSAPVNF